MPSTVCWENIVLPDVRSSCQHRSLHVELLQTKHIQLVKKMITSWNHVEVIIKEADTINLACYFSAKCLVENWTRVNTICIHNVEFLTINGKEMVEALSTWYMILLILWNTSLGMLQEFFGLFWWSIESNISQVCFCMHMVGIHQVILMVFDNYWRCPVPLHTD